MKAMTEELRSFLIGTLPLDLMMLAAAVLTVSRGAPERGRRARTRAAWIALVAVAVQSVHFVEEWVTGFNRRFPELLGLHPWSAELWVSFNLVWIAIWLASLVGVRRGLRIALFPVWFLAIASVINCLAHPLLAVAAAGYFPGLWTSPLAGGAGVLLWRSLTAVTDRERTDADLT